MRSFGTHGLACLDENDPAAVALFLQAEAERVDTLLGTQLDGFTSAYRRPTGIWRPLAAIPGVTIVTLAFGTNVFWNSANSPYVAVTGGSLPALPGNLPGSYHIGVMISTTPAGVATGSQHEVVVNILDTNGNVYGTGNDATSETGTGGEFLTCSFVINVPVSAPNVPRYISATWNETASGTNTINVASYCWATYLGPSIVSLEVS
jgi:hypothetical protein